MFEELITLSNAGRHREAAILATRLLADTPQHIQARLILAQSLLALGQAEPAEQAFAEVLKLSADNQAALTGRGMALIALGKHHDAIASLKRALSINGAEFSALSYLGLAQLHLKDFANAIPTLIRASELEPGSSKIWRNLGSAFMQVHSYDNAALAYQNALRLVPDNKDIASKFMLALNFANFTLLDETIVLRAFSLQHHDFLARHPHLHPVVAKVVNFEAWRTTNGLRTIEIDHRQNVNLTYGSPMIEDNYVAEATWVAELPNANIIAGWDFVIAPSGEVLDGSGYLSAQFPFPWLPHAYSRPSSIAVHLWSKEVTHIEQPVLFLSNPSEFQIGHWLVDFLPRLRALKAAGEIGEMQCVVPSNLPRRHREFLRMFGIEDRDLLELEFGRRYSFSSLWVVGQGHRNYPHPDKIRFLHGGLTRTSSHAPRRFYFDRRQSKRGRRVANIEEFEATLRDFDFQPIQLANLSAESQADILSSATIVIGSLGTDLASMFHLSVGADVLMLVQDNMDITMVEEDARAFERYAAILGMRSRRIVCASESLGTVKITWQRELYHRDIIVDCDALRRILTDVIKQQSENQRREMVGGDGIEPPTPSV